MSPRSKAHSTATELLIALLRLESLRREPLLAKEHHMRRRHLSLLAAATAGVLAAGVLTNVVVQVAATGCRVDYAISSQWQGGFGATVTITNLGDPIDG